MTKEEVWLKFCEVNPSFKTEYRVELSVDKIRKMIETAYKCGNDAGFDKGKAVAESLYKAANGNNMSGADMFNEVFKNFGKK